jgi:hypothetical protein
MRYIEQRIKNSEEEKIIDYLIERKYSKDIILETCKDSSLDLDKNLVDFYFKIYEDYYLRQKNNPITKIKWEIYRKSIELKQKAIENNHLIFPITMCLCKLIGG